MKIHIYHNSSCTYWQASCLFPFKLYRQWIFLFCHPTNNFAYFALWVLLDICVSEVSLTLACPHIKLLGLLPRDKLLSVTGNNTANCDDIEKMHQCHWFNKPVGIFDADKVLECGLSVPTFQYFRSRNSLMCHYCNVFIWVFFGSSGNKRVPFWDELTIVQKTIHRKSSTQNVW